MLLLIWILELLVLFLLLVLRTKVIDYTAGTFWCSGCWTRRGLENLMNEFEVGIRWKNHKGLFRLFHVLLIFILLTNLLFDQRWYYLKSLRRVTVHVSQFQSLDDCLLLMELSKFSSTKATKKIMDYTICYTQKNNESANHF